MKMSKDEKTTIVCPHCKSNNIWKFGKYHNRNRYRCKVCLKTFTNYTNKPWSYSKKSINYWKEYIKLMDFKYTLRECAAKLNMSLTTAFNWRHKLLNNICEAHKGEKLSNEVSIMKSKIKENRKGSRCILTSPRELHFSYATDINYKFFIDLHNGDITVNMYSELYKEHILDNTVILKTNNTIINAASNKFNKRKIKEKGKLVFRQFAKYKGWLYSFRGIASKNHTLYHFYFLNYKKIQNCFLI